VIIRDPIYGRFETPSFLDRLIMGPEVRRLMEVRLLNAPTPSVPTLSEIRRFSHTLGVLHLALRNPHFGLRKDEVRALLAAILIHDAATPPFAHLLEYYLKDRSGWNHESALPDVLTGHHVFENVAHQILPGEELKFKSLCASKEIDFELVLKIVRKEHPASVVLFGALDFDNLDNVLRMAWALGLAPDPAPFLKIAAALGASIDGEPILSDDLRSEVETWAHVRKTVYEILIFDEPTVASQAVLTKAIRLLFDGKQTSDINWARRDGDLLDLLFRSSETKEFMLRYYSGPFPSQLLALRIFGAPNDLGILSRDHAIEFIEAIAREEFGVKQPLAYAFVDRGTFSKRLEFIDASKRSRWVSGESSASVVFYCFASESVKEVTRIRKQFRESVVANLKRLGAHVDASKASPRLAS
jgi:HD superfamily phosphohydrolase